MKSFMTFNEEFSKLIKDGMEGDLKRARKFMEIWIRILILAAGES